MVNQTPEQIARDKIDAMLTAAGWSVRKSLNTGDREAVREYQTDVGPADYVLFINRQAVGVIEAKREEAGQNITSVELQTENYAAAKLKWVNNSQPLPFLYESTGIITRFTDARDPKPRSRELFSFHRPETLQEWLEIPKSLRGRIQDIPPLNPEHKPASELGLRDCQETAIINLEQSLKEDRPRALIQMATGAGKTYTAITAMYRMLKYESSKVKNVQFTILNYLNCLRRPPMPNKTEPTTPDENGVQIALRRAVKSTLERKKKLGHYSVIWRDNQIITQGEDAPPNSRQKAG